MSDNTELLAAAQPQASMQIDDKTMEMLVVGGDMSKLTSAQRLMFYKARCEAAGLDPRSQPFEYVSLQGKLTLYARKGATDQLAAIHGAKCRILSRETSDDIHSVIVEVSLRDGRSTEEIGCVNVKGLAGDNLANARMKAMTKSKRRAILSLCGLGMVDEAELETIPTARAWQEPPRTLDALVTRQEAPKEPPPPAAATDAPATLRTVCGLTVDLSQEWESWKGEAIGGANRNIQSLKWEDLTTSNDPGVIAAVKKSLDAGLAQEQSTGQPAPARFQRLAVAWAEREKAQPIEAI